MPILRQSGGSKPPITSRNSTQNKSPVVSKTLAPKIKVLETADAKDRARTESLNKTVNKQNYEAVSRQYTKPTPNTQKDKTAKKDKSPKSSVKKTVGVTEKPQIRPITKDKEPDTSHFPSLNLYYYQWNLPPHKWSLPVEPVALIGDDMVVDQEKKMVSIGAAPRYRRGRIYWYARSGTEYVNNKNYNNGSNPKDPRYGFQFLWNPESITTSVAVNLDITPTFADKFVDVAGAFPSGEVLAFTIRLDRTNDFASIKSAPKRGNFTYDQLAKNYATSEFYDGALSFDMGFEATRIQKIKDLQQLGTIADIEYLYKAINGPGWKNQATGRASSDIGFLSPTLLRIDIGPLSYLGYVNNIAVNHISFSKSMIPIRTDVTLNFNLMATAGLVTK